MKSVSKIRMLYVTAICIAGFSAFHYPAAYAQDYLGDARAHIDARDFLAALSAGEAALADNYANPEVHEVLGDVLRELGLPIAAAMFYERAFDLYFEQAIAGGHPGVKEKMARTAAKLAAAAAIGPPMLAESNARDESTLYYGMNAFALGSRDARAMREYASACISYRLFPQAENALTLAISSYGAMLPKDAFAADLHHLRGAARFYLEDYAGALSDYTLAEKNGLDSVTLYGNWAFALEALEKWSEALEMWRKVSKMDVPAENKAMVEEHIKLCEERLKS